jgi:bifunctional polynucleotide phosphatase/kinase
MKFNYNHGEIIYILLINMENNNSKVVKWKTNDEYYEGVTSKFKMTNKIASFDLDQTLIKVKSGKKFPKDENDWIWNYDNVPDKLKELSKEKYSIIIISNQAGIGTGKQPGNIWIEKLNQIVAELKIEIRIFCSIGKNKYRKPHSTFRDEFFDEKLDINSFYCGDAIGRKGDHSDTDYKFAINSNMQFKSPENVFLDKIDKLPKIIYPIKIGGRKKYKLDFDACDKEMLIMVGFQGSGKSTFAKKIEEKYKYVIINQDTLKTKAKCIKEATNNMKNKKSIIIDATNPSKEKRHEWIKLADEYNFSVRIVKIDEDIEFARHNNIYRSITQNIKEVPSIAYNIYKSNYEEPDISEGVEEILLIKSNYPDDKLYFKYLY